jgi:hypothetical protein
VVTLADTQVDTLLEDTQQVVMRLADMLRVDTHKAALLKAAAVDKKEGSL